MKKKSKATPTIVNKGKSDHAGKGSRKNTSTTTRNESRQRSGNNDPQKGSH